MVLSKWEELRVARCKLPVASFPLQVGHLPRAARNREAEFMQNLPPWGKTNKLSRSQRRQQPKTNVGRSRKTHRTHRMQLVMWQFSFLSLVVFF